MCNDFGSILIDLHPCAEMHESLSEVKKTFDKMKKSFMPFGVLYATKFSAMLPFTLARDTADDLTDKVSMVFSNL